MTNEEAKFWFICTTESEYIITPGEREAYTVAISALEKQIPKKPEESSDGYADGCAVIDYHCPNCGRVIDETDHHCICGQAIDWNNDVIDKDGNPYTPTTRR